MDIKDLSLSMQAIEFVLYSLQAKDRVTDEELEFAHMQAKKIINNYVLKKEGE